ncbi:MAG: hypothetical protein ABFD45_05465 [Smithella sp.]
MKGLLVLIAACLLASCAALPQVLPPAGSAEKNIRCPSPFLAEKTRLIHTIEVRTSGETKTVMIGVTLMDPFSRTIACALMSAEGMTLFEAVRGPEGMVVSRAFPPFDAADFAVHMMDDIELIFLAPQGLPAKKGVLAGGDQICRWHKTQGGWMEVSAGRDGRMKVHRYSEGGDLKRVVTLAADAANPYSTILLQASDLVNYALVMTLIQSESVGDKPGLKESLP